MLKSDPYRFQMQLRPDNASIVADISGYHWNDGEWMAQRDAWDPLRAPISSTRCIRARGVAPGIASPRSSPGTSSPTN